MKMFKMMAASMLGVAFVHQELKKNKFVKKYRLGQYGEGEDGVTIAEFGRFAPNDQIWKRFQQIER